MINHRNLVPSSGLAFSAVAVLPQPIGSAEDRKETPCRGKRCRGCVRLGQNAVWIDAWKFQNPSFLGAQNLPGCTSGSIVGNPTFIPPGRGSQGTPDCASSMFG